MPEVPAPSKGFQYCSLFFPAQLCQKTRSFGQGDFNAGRASTAWHGFLAGVLASTERSSFIRATNFLMSLYETIRGQGREDKEGTFYPVLAMLT